MLAVAILPPNETCSTRADENPIQTRRDPVWGGVELFVLGETRDTTADHGIMFRLDGRLGSWRSRPLLLDEPHRSTRGPTREKRKVGESKNHEQTCEDPLDQRKRMPCRWCDRVLNPSRRTMKPILRLSLGQRESSMRPSWFIAALRTNVVPIRRTHKSKDPCKHILKFFHRRVCAHAVWHRHSASSSKSSDLVIHSLNIPRRFINGINQINQKNV